MSRVIAHVTVAAVLAVSAQASAYHVRDDFDHRSDRWLWIEEGGGARIAVGGGLCTLRLTDPPAERYCNAEIVNRNDERYLYGSLEVRCRATRMRPGSRGWGWWDRNKLELVEDFDVAWVMQSADYSDNEGTNWLRWGHCAGTMRDRTWRDLAEEIDPREWHVYRLEWTPAFISLSIDGVLLHRSSEQVPDEPMSLDIWVDNQPVGSYGPTFLYHTWQGTSELLVDYVEIRGSRLRAGGRRGSGGRRRNRGTITLVGLGARKAMVAVPRGFSGKCRGYSLAGRLLFSRERVRSGDVVHLPAVVPGPAAVEIVAPDGTVLVRPVVW